MKKLGAMVFAAALAGAPLFGCEEDDRAEQMEERVEAAEERAEE